MSPEIVGATGLALPDRSLRLAHGAPADCRLSWRRFRSPLRGGCHARSSVPSGASRRFPGCREPARPSPPSPSGSRSPTRSGSRRWASLETPRNVFVWSKAHFGAGREKASADVQTPGTWGTGVGSSTVYGYELQAHDTDVASGQEPPIRGGCYEGGGLDTSAFVRIPVPEGARLGVFRSWAYDNDPDQDLHDLGSGKPASPTVTDPPASTLIAETSTLGSIGQYPGTKSLNGLTVDTRNLCLLGRGRIRSLWGRLQQHSYGSEAPVHLDPPSLSRPRDRHLQRRADQSTSFSSSSRPSRSPGSPAAAASRRRSIALISP